MFQLHKLTLRWCDKRSRKDAAGKQRIFCICYFSTTKSKLAKKKLQGDFFLFNWKPPAKIQALSRKKNTHTHNKYSNKPYLYSWYWNGTTLEWRLRWENIINNKRRLLPFAFEEIYCISLVASYTVSNKQFINKTCLCPGLNASIA